MKRTLMLMAGMAMLAAPVAADAQNRGKATKRDNQTAAVRDLNMRQLAQIESGMQGGMAAAPGAATTMGAGTAGSDTMSGPQGSMSGSGMTTAPGGDTGTSTGMQGDVTTDPATDQNSGTTPPRQ